MARKSNKQIAAEGALANLNCIHDIASEGDRGEVYHRNAYDCGRWCRTLKDVGMPWPAWMIAGNLKYFATIWQFTI